VYFPFGQDDMLATLSVVGQYRTFTPNPRDEALEITISNPGFYFTKFDKEMV